MMRRITGTMFVLIAAAVLLLPAVAQESDVLIPVTLEEITSNSSDYYGEQVIIEGFVNRFVNVDSFILGENATVDNDQVLVINNSGNYLPANLFSDDQVVVTGLVHRSLDSEDGNNQPEAEATEDSDMSSDTEETDMMAEGMSTMAMYYAGQFPQAYSEYTVIEVIDIANVEKFEEE